MNETLSRIELLPCWNDLANVQTLSGGITNQNFLVTDAEGRYVVRIGDDIPVHHVMRFNEHAASRAAASAGISPRVHFSEPGALVIDYIDAAPLTSEDVRACLPEIVALIKQTHVEVPKHLHGPALAFWVFHILRDYAYALLKDNYDADLKTLMAQADQLERSVGAIDMTFSHNDLLAANFLHDGNRLWLIDWDYAGFNSALFDLGGLASNNELSQPEEIRMLEGYFERPLDGDVFRRYTAMKTASLLRETLWSMVSEVHSKIDFDYSSYTRLNLEKFQAAWSDFKQV